METYNTNFGVVPDTNLGHLNMKKCLGKTMWHIVLYLLVTIGISMSLVSCKKRNKEYKTKITKDYIIKGSCGENVQFKLYKNGKLKIDGEGPMDDYDFNEESQKSTAPWSKYQDKINVLDIQGISTVGSYSFCGLQYVKEIVIPSTVKSINKSAFSGMESLKTITFQGDLDYIGEYALCSCKSLYSITFNGKVKTLDYACFQNNESLEELIIPNGVTELPNSLCTFCKKLKIIKLPNTVKRINLSFYDCPKLEKVELPSSLEYIDMAAFTNDVNLKEIIVPQNVLQIENLGTSPQLNRRITILCKEIPKISCAFGGYDDVNFDLYVLSHLLSEYRETDELRTLPPNRIHSIDGNTVYISNYYDNPINSSYSQGNSYNTQETMRQPCRTCNNTGYCPLCGGSGQTHTKRVYNYSLGCYDLDYETCHSCRGSGSCTACKGDGWLDEGVDY